MGDRLLEPNTLGDGPIRYSGHSFLTVAEAQWAVFFHAAETGWHYDANAEWGLSNAQRYRPQFFLPRLKGYLEVQRPDDHRVRQPLLHDCPEIEEPAVYFAVGDLPDERQLSITGWWDSERHRGVMNLTPCFGWEMWFPPNSFQILAAMEVARTKELESVPLARQPMEEVRDIPEREREQRPE
jgi:hypothetical protein